MGGVLSRSQKIFSLLLLPSAALAWAPAPGIPLERQIPVNRQTTGAGSGSGSGCDFEPWTQECNATRTQNVLGEKGRRIRELTSVVQKRFNFPEGTVELYAEKVQ